MENNDSPSRPRTRQPTAGRLLGFGALVLFAAMSIDTSPAFPRGSDGEELAYPELPRLLAETFHFRNGQPASVKVTPSGDAVLFLRSGPRSFERDLYLFDPDSGEERRLLTAEDLLGGDEEELSAEEKARRERMRLAAGGIATYSLSKDGERILAPLSDRLFLVEVASGEVREVPAGPGGRAESFPFDPQLSPDAGKVGFVLDGDLYVVELESGERHRLTRRDSETVTHGLAEFVAQEEMDRYHGFWWSPDGEFLAYQRTDTAGMEVFRIADPFDPSRPPQEWPYPRPGKKNAEVRLGVVPAAGGETVWVEWDRERYPYLATVKWPEGAPLTILLQNREQTEELLLAVDAATGATEEMLVERDPAWINLDQKMPRWLPGGDGFLWTTERNGWWQLELRARDGSLRHTVTPPGFPMHGFLHLDGGGEHVHLLASEDPTESHVYRLPLRPEDGAPRRLTRDPGVHGAVFAEGGELWVDAHEAVDEAPAWIVRDGDGRRLGKLGSEQAAPPFEVRPELVRVGEEPGFDAAVVRPNDFDPGLRYPVIVRVYGGPHKQMVTASRDDYLLDQWLAEQGYLVVRADGRGTPNRGREWERAIRSDFIGPPLEDQVRAIRALGERFPAMDVERVGIFGWSYGGYFSAMAVMQHPELFDVGVAGAPVTDWHDYDTHYTERYIGLPDADPEAYERSSVLSYASRLERPLLIIHGTADDNVYFLHGLKMSDALLRAGRDHVFLPLPGATHMVREPEQVERMYGRILGFLGDHLGEPSPGAGGAAGAGEKGRR